jgi:hypothetical protein
MNLALSTSQLFTQYLNDAYGVTQADYSNLGRLMITVGAIGLLPLLLLPMLRRSEDEPAPPSAPTPVPAPPEHVAVPAPSVSPTSGHAPRPPA